MKPGCESIAPGFFRTIPCYQATVSMYPNTGLFRLHPLAPLCVALAAGVHFGRPLAAVAGVCGLACAFGLALLVAALLPRRLLLQTWAILLAALLLGSALMALADRRVSVALPPGPVSWQGVVSGEPVERGRTLRFDATLTSGPLCGHTVRVSLLKDTASCRYRSLRVGVGFEATSRLEAPANFGASNFDYATYLKGRGIVAQTFVYHSHWRSVPVSLAGLSAYRRARLAAHSLRASLLGRYRELGLEGQAYAVVAAMAFGDKSALSDDILDAYSATGASHVLALSGMHLSTIYLLLSFLTLGRRFRLARESLLLAAIWAYVFLVGMAPSVMRSAVMLTVYSFVSMSGRGRMSVNALSFAAIVLLVANPFVLYDIGFQLSFMAVAFIVAFRFLMGAVDYSYQQRHPVVRWLWQTFAVSLLAQLGTAPLVAYYFGRLSLVSLLLNFVVIPLSTAILYASAAALVLFAVPVVRQLVALLLAAAVVSLNSVLLFVARWPWASFDGLHISRLQVALSYVAIVCLLHFLRLELRRRRERAF